MHKHLITALEIASTNVYDPFIDYHLAAVIVGGGAIISQGVNTSSSNGFVEHYTTSVTGKKEAWRSTHAEMSAILQCRRKTDLTGCKIFVARRGKEKGGPAMARPCMICEQVLLAYGIMTLKKSGSSDRIVRI